MEKNVILKTAHARIKSQDTYLHQYCYRSVNYLCKGIDYVLMSGEDPYAGDQETGGSNQRYLLIQVVMLSKQKTQRTESERNKRRKKHNTGFRLCDSAISDESWAIERKIVHRHSKMVVIDLTMKQ